jgi:tRNA(fMet)-specific endonuclease VapC
LNVLDTSALIDLFRGSEAAKSFIDDEAVTTTITYYEIFQRIKHRNSKAEDKFFRYFFSCLRVLDYDVHAAEVSSDIMANLMSLGTPVNGFDVLIAGIAVANGAEKLITRDRDFLKISEVADIEVLVY